MIKNIKILSFFWGIKACLFILLCLSTSILAKDKVSKNKVLVGFKVYESYPINGLVPIFKKIQPNGALSVKSINGVRIGKKGGTLKEILKDNYIVSKVIYVKTNYYDKNVVTFLKIELRHWNNPRKTITRKFGSKPPKKIRRYRITIPNNQIFWNAYGNKGRFIRDIILQADTFKLKKPHKVKKQSKPLPISPVVQKYKGPKVLVGFKINVGDIIDGLTPIYKKLHKNKLGKVFDGVHVGGKGGNFKIIFKKGPYIASKIHYVEGNYFGHRAIGSLKIQLRHFNNPSKVYEYNVGPANYMKYKKKKVLSTSKREIFSHFSGTSGKQYLSKITLKKKKIHQTKKPTPVPVKATPVQATPVKPKPVVPAPKSNKNSYSLIHAVKTQNANLVFTLLTSHSSINVNFKDSQGNTALHYAAQSGNVNITQMLIVHGKARVNIKNNQGHTPLQLAGIKGKANVIQYLVTVGAR